MKKIAIYGASGHGKVVADIAQLCGYEVVFFVDDDATKKEFDGKKVFSFEKVKEMKDISFALGIGQNLARQKVYDKLKNSFFDIVTLVHKSAIIADSVEIGEGTIVMALSVINSSAVIGNGVILNTSSVVEHDCVVSDFVHISPRVALAGSVSIGKLAHLGIGSCVIQCLNIGEFSTIGAGSVVIGDIPNNTLAVGVPAKVIKSF